MHRSPIISLLLVIVTGTAWAATPQEIDKAIADGKAWLYRMQKPDGTWETVPEPAKVGGKLPMGGNPEGGQWGGQTAIATYALLAAGDSHQDPRLVRAIEFLKKADLQGIYAIGVRAQIWSMIPPSPETRTLAKHDADLLLAAMEKKPPDLGFYGYNTFPSAPHHSTSQYGVLGMWACQQAGAEVSDAYWKIVEDAWRRTQQPDGGWSYFLAPTPERPISISMTAAGVATLFITQDYLHSNDGIKCKPAPPNEPIERGMKWIASHFDSIDDPYGWYGVERIGVASGYKYFGNIDWYQAGADQFVKTQSARDGCWFGKLTGYLPGTAFAVLFLSRGGAPVVMNKLDYSAAAPAAKSGAKPAEPDLSWNCRPRDVANAVRWMSRQTERPLNWQITNLTSTPEEMMDAPILYIAGPKLLALPPQQREKIRDYIQLGGVVLGNADCGNLGFANSFKELGTQLFPGYTWRELPADHPIYTDQQFPRTRWKTRPSILGLSNGVRELMLLIPQADAGRAWQISDKGNEAMFEFATDLFEYVMGKTNLRTKGGTFVVTASPQARAARTVRVARLKYAGNWDPEPGAWRRMGNILLNTANLAVETSAVEIDAASLNPKDYPLAHLTTAPAATAFTLSEPQQKALRDYVAAGGTLLVDVAGGDRAAAGAMEEQLRRVFPEDAKQLDNPLPPDDAFFAGPTTSPATKPATTQVAVKLEYRSFARKSLGNTTSQRLRGIRRDGRLAVIFSPDDLTAGLLGVPTDGISGYTPDAAVQVVRGVLRMASGR